jgi:hypothetical protein
MQVYVISGQKPCEDCFTSAYGLVLCRWLGMLWFCLSMFRIDFTVTTRPGALSTLSRQDDCAKEYKIGETLGK